MRKESCALTSGHEEELLVESLGYDTVEGRVGVVDERGLCFGVLLQHVKPRVGHNNLGGALRIGYTHVSEHGIHWRQCRLAPRSRQV